MEKLSYGECSYGYNTMIAELKEIYSLELDCPLNDFYPDKYDFFELNLKLDIGPLGEDKSDSFSINICTPKWLESCCNNGEPMTGRHILIVNEYNFDKIRNYIDLICKQCSGDNWHEIALKLSRYVYWQFEDYKF